MNQIGFKANIGYDIIPQLFVFAQIEGEKYLYKSGDVKTHFSSNTLGGGLGAILFDTKDDKGSMGTIDARFAVGTTVGNPELKATTYDFSINWKILRGITPNLGIGLPPYQHSHLGNAEDERRIWNARNKILTGLKDKRIKSESTEVAAKKKEETSCHFLYLKRSCKSRDLHFYNSFFLYPQ